MDFALYIAPVIYFMCGVGADKIIKKAGIDRPTAFNIALFPVVLIVFAMSNIDEWE